MTVVAEFIGIAALSWLNGKNRPVAVGSHCGDQPTCSHRLNRQLVLAELVALRILQRISRSERCAVDADVDVVRQMHEAIMTTGWSQTDLSRPCAFSFVVPHNMRYHSPGATQSREPRQGRKAATVAGRCVCSVFSSCCGGEWFELCSNQRLLGGQPSS